MNLTEKEKQQFYEQFRKINEKVANEFSYLMLNDESQNVLIQQAFVKFIENEVKKDDLTFEIENYLNNEYKKLLKKLLEETDNKKILNSYTNNYFKNHIKDKKTIEKVLETYTDELISLIPDISYEDCLYLVQNNTNISRALQKVFGFIDTKSDDLDELLQTNLSILIEPYCQLNNINMELAEDSQDDFLDSSFEEQNKKGDYLSNNIVQDYLRMLPPALSSEEEKKCFLALAAGNQEMRNYLIEHNLKFVVTIAKRYQNKGLPLMDLIQEGNIGLMKAIDRFDVTKGFKFVSYASWWIRQAIIIALNDKGRTIRLPAYVNQKLRKINHIKHHIYNDLGHDATNKEIAEYLNISEKELEEFLSNTSDSVSYNVTVGDDEESELQDFLEDDKIDIEESFAKKDLKNQMIPAIKKLSDREQYIIIERFVNERSLNYVSQRLNITRERVRQIEEKALAKLRDNTQVKHTRVYLDNPESTALPKKKLTLMKTIGSKRDCVLEAISYLNDNDKKLLVDNFGKNYENKVELSDNKELNELIIKLKTFAYAIKNKDKVVVIDKDLFSYFTIDMKEDVLNCIDKLSLEKKNLLSEKYPKGFDKKPKKLSFPNEEYLRKEIFGNLYKLLKSKRHEDAKRSNNIIKLSSLNEAYSKLTKSEQEYLLKKYNRNDSQESYYLESLFKLNSDNDEIFKKLIDYANNIENTGKYNLDIEKIPFISLTKAVSNDEVKYHLTFLLPSEINLLKVRFGKDFLQKIDLHDIEYPKKKRIIQKIIPKLNERISNLRVPLEKALNVDKDIVKEAINFFEINDQRLINTLYNYEDTDYVLVEDDYIRLVTKLVPVLKNIINNLNTRGNITYGTSLKIANLYDINNLSFDTSSDNLKRILLQLSKEEQAIFYKKFGNNLDENNNLNNEESRIYNSICIKIKNVIAKEEILKRDLRNIKQLYVNLNPETRKRLSEKDRTLLDYLFLEDNFETALDNSLQKDPLCCKIWGLVI